MTLLTTAFAQGTHASRPAAASSNNGFYYYETDTTNLFQSTGSAWQQVASQSGSSSVGYLGSTTITASFTTASTTPVQVTSLTATVTIPASGHTKVTVCGYDIENNTGTDYAEISLWDGTVGSGTRLAGCIGRSSNASDVLPFSITWVGQPAAGAKTYNVGLCNAGTAGTAKINAAATNPCLLLVEQI